MIVSSGNTAFRQPFPAERSENMHRDPSKNRSVNTPNTTAQRNRPAGIWKRLALDVLIAGAALMVFALFHHVLPRQQQSLNIVIPNPYETRQDTDSALLPEGSTVIASATVSDAGTVSASGSRKSSKGGTSQGGSSKGGSALTQESADPDTEEEAEEVPMSEKFADQFTDTVVVTENSYSSPDIAITVTKESADGGNITYYLADIYVRDITCFQSALARDTFGSGYRDSIPSMASLSGALLAVNGDYYGNTSEGVVIRNGVIYRANPTACDVCVLYYDGSMRVMAGADFSVEEAIEDGAWQAWTFGPALLDTDGNILTRFNSTGRIISANPRTAIGYWEPGHYCMVVVDGRGESDGMTLPELSQLFYDLGCKAAYNLDGGNSSVMVFENAVVNDPSGGGRESSDALLIAEVRDHDE